MIAHVVFCVILIVMTIMSPSPFVFATSDDEEYQKAIHQKLKQKHNLKKMNLSSFKARSRDRGRPHYHSHSNKKSDSNSYSISAKRPRLNFMKYDQLLKSTNVSSGFVAPVHTRMWTVGHHSVHKWSQAPISHVEALYAPIEIGHGYSTSPDTTSTKLGKSPNQQNTSNKNNKKSILTNIIPTVFPPKNTGRRKDDLWIVQKSKVNLRNYPQCQLGYFKENGFVTQHRQTPPKCTSRGIQDRMGLRASWENVNSSASVDLLHSLTKQHSAPRDVTNLIFFGDSVSTQLVQALVCDLIRAGVRYSPRTNLTIRAYEETVSEFIIPKEKQQSSINHINNATSDASADYFVVRIHSKRFDFPCLTTTGGYAANESTAEACFRENHFKAGRLAADHSDSLNNRVRKVMLTNDNFMDEEEMHHHQSWESIIYNFTTQLLLNFSSNSFRTKHTNKSNSWVRPTQTQRTISIFNYGLHLQEMHKWVIPVMASALLDTSRLRREKVEAEHSHTSDEDSYLYRETSNQAFSFSRDGYHNRTFAVTGKNNSNDFCCRLPLDTPFTKNNWRNYLVIDSFNSLDPHWPKSLGWVPLFNTTLELFDLHVEYNSRTSIVDCTHFFYVPAAFAALWWDLKEAVAKIMAPTGSLGGG